MSDQAKTVLVVGSLNMDLVVTTPRHPEIGETISASNFNTFPGGKGANQAVAAARLGAKVRMIGKLGRDAFGDQLCESITRDGVDATFVTRDPHASTGVALITVNERGENTIVIVAGANGRVTARDVRAAEGAFEGASILLLQHELPQAAIEQAIHMGRSHGLKIVLNPAPARDLPAGLLTEVDYLIPNETELFLLSGLDSLEASINMLIDVGVRNLIVTLGSEGALLATPQQQTHVPAFRIDPVDTTAAGDAFVGAFAVALSEGLDLNEAVRHGSAAGALAATRPGAQPSLPTRQELEQFLRKHAPGKGSRRR